MSDMTMVSSEATELRETVLNHIQATEVDGEQPFISGIAVSRRYHGSENWNLRGSAERLARHLVTDLLNEQQAYVLAITETGTSYDRAIGEVELRTERALEAVALLRNLSIGRAPGVLSDGVLRALASYVSAEMRSQAEALLKRRVHFAEKAAEDPNGFYAVRLAEDPSRGVAFRMPVL